MRHIKWMIPVGGIVVAVTASLGIGQEPSIETIMQRKLDHAHAVLEALISEDYETLEDSADALTALSEEAAWFVLQTPEYAQRSAGFRLAVAEIKAGAEKRSVESAALGYVDMTLKCVQCHQLLRGTQRAEEFAPNLGDSAQPSASSR